MKKFVARATRFTAIFLAVFALVFSSVPYQALNSLISDYVRHYKVVDQALTALEPKTAEARIEFAGDGLMVYSQSGNSTPRQRFWIQSNLAFQAASSTVAGNIALQTRVMTSPTRREAVAGYVNNAGNLRIACFDGETWTDEWNVSVGGTGTTRRFDIAYEKTSGDVMVLYSTNTGTTNELAYRTKAGSVGCGAGNWSAATNVDPVRTSGVVSWVRLEAQPLNASNRIAAMWLDANADVSALHWDGSAWQSEPAAALETNTERASAAADTESFDLAWETLSGELMVILSSVSGTNGTTGAYWSTSTCTTSCTWRSATSSIAILDDATHLDVAADPLSDQIAFYALGNAGADTSAAIWNGNAWTASANRDTAAQAPTAGRRFVSVGWLNNGGTKRAVATYYDSATTNIGWDVANGTVWTLQTDATPTPAFGTQTQYKVIQNPYVPSELLFVVHDGNSDLFVKRLTMTATPAFTWSNADGSAALEASGASTIYPFGDFAFWNYIRPAIQVVQDTDPAPQTLAPGAATTSANVFRLRTSTSTETVTQVTVNLDGGGAADVFGGVGAVQIFRPGDNTSLGIAYNPGSDVVNVSVSGMTATTSSSTPYQVRITPKTHANMPSPPGASYTLTPLVTAVSTGGTAVSESFDSVSNSTIIDNLSPGNVTSATVTAADAANNLTWTNPGDGDLSTVIVLQRTGGVVTDVPAEGQTYATSSTIGASTVVCSGLQTSCAVGSLTNGTAYHYEIFTQDTRGNWDVGVVPTGSPATPAEPTFEQSNYRLFGNQGTRTEFGTAGALSAAADSNLIEAIATDSVWMYVFGGDISNAWRIEKRSLATGALDNGFGSSGVLTTTGVAGTPYDMAIDSTWMYLVGSNSGDDWRIEKRSLATGALDNGFGTSGVVTGDATSFIALGIAIDSTWMYVAGRDASQNLRIEKRSLATGALDNGFGTSGVVTGAALSYFATDVAIDSTWLYAVGLDDNLDLRIEKRSLATGALDNGFGTSGVVTGAALSQSAESVAIDSTWMYVAGVDDSNNWRIEKRSLANGSLDNNFGASGVVTADAATNIANGISIDSSWMYVVGDTSTSDWRIEKRSLATGALDNGFGTSGVVTADAATEVAYASAINSTWIYIVGTGSDFAWRIERRTTGTGALAQNVDLGMPLAAQNSSSTLTAADQQFRLRQLIRVGTSPQSVNGGSRAWKLQYAVRSGTCDTSFSGEAYSDVTGATPIAYFDNTASGMTDGIEITSTSTDPTGVSSSAVRPQTYEEANNFTNSIAAVTVGENMLFDFSLRDNGAPAGTSYCLRVVSSSGSALNTYTQIPEVRIYSVPGITISGTFFEANGFTTLGDITPLKLAVGASTAYTVGSAGTFSFSSITQPSEGTIMTLWSTSGATGTLVFKYGANCTGYPNCTGLSLLRDHIFLRSFSSDPGSGSITNSDLSSCDNSTGTVCGQTPTTRIGFTADAGDGPIDFQATNATSTLRIGTGTTYAPGGSVTADNVQVDGTLDTGSGNGVRVTGWGTSNTCGFGLVNGSPNDPAPFCVNGGSISGTGYIEYQTPTSTAIQSRAYPNLSLVSSPGASPTYSLVGTSAFSATNLFVGNSGFGSTVTFSASTTNPTMSITNLDIDAGSTFVCSTSTMSISGNFENNGYIDTRGNTITLNTTTSGRTLNGGTGTRTGRAGDLDVAFDGDGVVISASASNIPYATVRDDTWLYIGGDNSSGDWRIEKRSLATGALDTNFGTSGVVTGDSTSGEVYNIAIDSTWMYIVGGTDSFYNWRIEKRSLATGALDANFGTNGVIIGDTISEIAYAVAIDSTWMYVVGYQNDSANDWRIEKRSLATGALDTSFGTSGVVVGSSSTTSANDIAIDSTSMYVVGGDSGGTWRIEKRTLTTGSLSTSVTSAALSSSAAGISIDSTWMYVVGLDDNIDWRIEKRSLSALALDTSFGVSGVVTSTDNTNAVNDIAIDSTWMYVFGATEDPTWRIEKRSLSTGALDNSFGVSGAVISAAASTVGNAMVIDSSWAYVVGIATNNNWRIEKRALGSGAGDFDPMFGNGGSISGDVITSSPSVVVFDQNSIYIGGSDSNLNWRIEKRSRLTGELDLQFGTSGITESTPPRILQSMAIDNNWMYLVGYIDTPFYRWRIEKRSLTTGAPDTNFGTSGAITGAAPTQEAFDIAIDSTWMYVVGYNESPFNLRVEKRSLATGAFDTNFGVSGVATSSVSNSGGYGIAIDSTWMYIVGSAGSPSDWRIEKRSLATGAFDTNFGVSGVASIDSTTKTAMKIAIDSTWMYVVGQDDSNNWRIEKRSLATGAPDSNFGTSGVVTGATISDRAEDIFIDSTWMYVVGDNDTAGWRIEKRSLATGALDTSFGDSGVIMSPSVAQGAISVAGDQNYIYVAGFQLGSAADWRIEKRSKESRPAPTFTNLTLSGSGGWTVPTGPSLVVSENLSLNNGILGGTGDIMVRNGNLSGNGSLAMTGGTITQRNGLFGGDPAWTANNLNFGTAADSIARTVTANGTGAVTVAGVLNLLGNTTLAAGNKTWNLDAAGTPLVIGSSATFSPQSSTVAYRSVAGGNVVPIRYNNLLINDNGTAGVGNGIETFTVLAPTNTLGTAWPYARNITIDPRYYSRIESLSTASTTVFVSAASPDFRTQARGGKMGRADAGDVAFVVNGQRVAHDVLRYDGEEGAITAAFQARGLTFTSTAQPTITMFYGNPSAGVMEDKAATWSRGTGAPYAGVWHLGEDPGATTTAVSAASSTWNGTYVNMGSANTLDGVFGRAAMFNGSNTYINLPQNLIRNSTTGSLSMWFRTTSNGPLFGYRDTVIGGATPGEFVPVLYVGTDGLLRGQVWQGAVGPISSGSVVNNGQWRHVALTWSGTTQSLYLDGQLIGTLAGTVNHLNMANNYIGYSYFGNGWPNGWSIDAYFNGMIDEVRESTVARSATDIFLEYENGRRRQDFASVASADSAYGLFVDGNLTLSGADNTSLDLNTNNVPAVITGNTTINSGNALNAPAANALVLRGNFVNDGNFFANNGTVTLAPVGDVMSITGSVNTQFATATAAAPGKTIQFKNDSVGNFTQFARMIFSGLPGLPLTLQSTSQGSKWNMNLTSLSGSSLDNVAIRDGGCHSSTARFVVSERVLNLGNSDDCWGFTVRGTGSIVTGGGGTPQGGGGQGGSGAPNIALNAPVNASSNNEGTFGSYRLTDGSRGAQPWVSGTGLPQTADIDLGQRYAINAVNLFWESSFSRTFTLQVSDNLSSWTTITTATSDSTQNPTFSGLSGQGRYIRLNITSSAQGDQRLNEIEVYGTVTSGGGSAQGGGGSGGGGGAAP